MTETTHTISIDSVDIDEGLTLDIPPTDLIPFCGLHICGLSACLRSVEVPVYDLGAYNVVGKAVWISTWGHHGGTGVSENRLHLWSNVEADDLISRLVA